MQLRYIVLLLALWAALAACAGSVGWRMDGSGRYPAATPPANWSATDHVLWATPLPAWSNASPVLVGERIFVCAEPSTLLCLDRSGKILWQQHSDYADLPADGNAASNPTALADIDRQIAEASTDLTAKRTAVTPLEEAAKADPTNADAQEKLRAAKSEISKGERSLNKLQQQREALQPPAEWSLPKTQAANGYSSDTPVSDGTFVYTSFGTGVVSCFTVDGVRQWTRFVEKPTHMWGHSASPVLVGDTLVIQYLSMFGLDAKTGATRWHAKHKHIWGTPAVARLGTRDVLIADGGNIVSVADGTPLASTGMPLEYNSPFFQDGVIYCVSDNKARAFQLALKDDATVAVTQLWETTVSKERYYASPLLADGLLYLINQRGVLSVLDAKDGTLAYEQRLDLGGTAYPTPILAGKTILLSSDTGKSISIAPGRTYQELTHNALEPYRTTPVCDGTRLYIRTTNKESKLYCIGG